MNNILRNPAKVTLALVAINALLWVGQILPGSPLTQMLWFAPAYGVSEPWRFITSGFVHDPNSPLHVLINMYSIYIFGSTIEPLLGRGRFIALYLVSALGGSVAVLWLGDPYTPVVGASGAFFGLMGAYFVLMRTLGVRSNQIVGLIGINLVFSFMIPGISWQGHVGGLLAGGAVGSLYANTRGLKQQTAQKLGLLAIVAVFVVLAIYKANNLSL